MQNIHPYALIATFFIAACQMNKELQSPHYQDGLYTWMEEISPTKTALDEGNIIVWSEDDKISVSSHSGAGEKKYLIDNESVGKSQGSFHPVDPIDTSDEKKAITAVH